MSALGLWLSSQISKPYLVLLVTGLTIIVSKRPRLLLRQVVTGCGHTNQGTADIPALVWAFLIKAVFKFECGSHKKFLLCIRYRVYDAWKCVCEVITDMPGPICLFGTANYRICVFVGPFARP